MAKSKFSNLIGLVLAAAVIGGGGYVLLAEDVQPAAVGALTEFPKVSLASTGGGEAVKIQGDHTKLVAFVSETCHTCHEAMDALIKSPMMEQQNFRIYYIWEKDTKNIPQSAQHPSIENLVLDKKQLANETYGWSSTPRFYLLDGKNRVIVDELGFSPSIQKNFERRVTE